MHEFSRRLRGCDRKRVGALPIAETGRYLFPIAACVAGITGRAEK